MVEISKPLSISSLLLYEECPYHFYLRYIQRAEKIYKDYNHEPMRIGSFCHKIFEYFHNIKLPVEIKDPKQEFHDIILEILKRGPDIYFSFSEEGQKKIDTILENFVVWEVEEYQKLGRQYFTPCMTEQKFYTTINGIEVVSIIDRIDKDPKHEAYDMSDYKTGRYNSRYSRGYKLQAMLYHIQIENNLGITLRNRRAIYLGQLNIKNFPASPELRLEVEQLLNRVTKGIKRGEFPRKRGWNCDGCDVSPYCTASQLTEKGLLGE